MESLIDKLRVVLAKAQLREPKHKRLLPLRSRNQWPTMAPVTIVEALLPIDHNLVALLDLLQMPRAL